MKKQSPPSIIFLYFNITQDFAPGILSGVIRDCISLAPRAIDPTEVLKQMVDALSNYTCLLS